MAGLSAISMDLELCSRHGLGLGLLAVVPRCTTARSFLKGLTSGTNILIEEEEEEEEGPFLLSGFSALDMMLSLEVDLVGEEKRYWAGWKRVKLKSFKSDSLSFCGTERLFVQGRLSYLHDMIYA